MKKWLHAWKPSTKSPHIVSIVLSLKQVFNTFWRHLKKTVRITHNLFTKEGEKENSGALFLFHKLADSTQAKKKNEIHFPHVTWRDHQIIWEENAYVWGEMAGESSTEWILIVFVLHSSVSSFVAETVDKKVTDISHCEQRADYMLGANDPVDDIIIVGHKDMLQWHSLLWSSETCLSTLLKSTCSIYFFLKPGENTCDFNDYWDPLPERLCTVGIILFLTICIHSKS